MESSHYLACYTALYEMAPVGCYILGREGTITECNEAGARLLGAPEDLCGREIQTLVVPESQPMLAAGLANLRSGGAERALIVMSEAGSAGPRQLSISMKLSPDSEAILMVASEYERPAEG